MGTPTDNSVSLSTESNTASVDKEMYQSCVGSLLYLSTWSRPDITYAVNKVSQYCANPFTEHWTAVKRILRYLKGTINYGLVFTKSESDQCIGYSDADWAGDINNRKSTSGYLFKIGSNTVSWRSKKQSCVALSTAEAEYMALSSAAQEAVWLQELIGDINDRPASPVEIFEDNQAAINIAKHPQFHGRTKHISIKFHYVRELVNENKIIIKYCPTEKMIADILTKGLAKDKFIKCRNMTGVDII